MNQATKTLLCWGLLIVMLTGIYVFPSWAPFAAICTLMFAALYRRRVLKTENEHNAAIHAANAHIAARRFDDAERVIEPLEKSRLPQFRTMFHVERAVIAMSRGDRDSALAALAHIDEQHGHLHGGMQREAALQGRSVRAFLRASAGDAAGAREDIAAVRALPDADSVLLARASLAEARLLDEAGDRAALAALFDRDRWLLLPATGLQERALVRAYEAMLDASASSVYRQRADRTRADDESRVNAAWVAAFAPNAAPFVRGETLPAGESGEGARPEQPSEKARRKLAAARSKRFKPRPNNALPRWFLGVLGFIILYQATAPGADEWKSLSIGGFFLFTVGSIFWIVRARRRQTRDTNRINAALLGLSMGELPTDELALEAKAPMHRAQAAHVLAEIALRRGEPAEAVAQCDKAFAALAEAQGGKLVAPVDAVVGEKLDWDFARILAAQRAFALAALNRADEAWAEIEWAKGFPSGLAVFRVLLLTRLRARDYEGAAGAVEARDPAVILPLRDRALAEIARFVGRPASRNAETVARLRAEMCRDPALAPWIDAMAPRLLGAFERAAASAVA
jgi:hypothetical protein